MAGFLSFWRGSVVPQADADRVRGRTWLRWSRSRRRRRASRLTERPSRWSSGRERAARRRPCPADAFVEGEAGTARRVAACPKDSAVRHLLPRTRRAMRSAAITGGSCSHTLTTRQPAASKAASFARSRSTFRSSLARQYDSLVLGCTPCSGQRCQKHPSTITRTRGPGNTTSARHRTPGTGALFLKKRRPRRCSAERSRTSGRVSELRLPCMAARTPRLLGGGAGGRLRDEPGGERDAVMPRS
jgi:hypothetical protein